MPTYADAKNIDLEHPNKQTCAGDDVSYLQARKTWNGAAFRIRQAVGGVTKED